MQELHLRQEIAQGFGVPALLAARMRVEPLGGLAQGGQAAAGNRANAGANFGAQAGNARAGMGNAQAAGAIGVGNAITGGINNAMGVMGWMGAQPKAQAPAAGGRPWWLGTG